MGNISKFHYDMTRYREPLLCGKFKVVQIGDLCCSANYDVAEHEQEYLEFSYIESGKAFFRISQNTFVAEPGDLILNRPGDIHQITSAADDPVRFFYFSLVFCEDHPEYERFREMKAFFDTTNKRVLHNALSTYQLFYKAFNETSSDKPFALEMLEACLTEILIVFYRSMNDLGRTFYFSKANKQTEDELVNSVIEILNSGDLCERRLGDLGREIGYSYPYLSQIFSRKMGQSIRSYHQRLRFEKAIDLLNDNISITRIAETLGYTSIHSFSRAFARYYGASPSKYLEQNGIAPKKDRIPEKKQTDPEGSTLPTTNKKRGTNT